MAARRKNATRESTATLKSWLNEHKKNPYPTKGEKIMLAIITKMTLTQVSTWFANARRRLKKENKMTWEPKNKTDDDDDDDAGSSECEDKDKDDMLMGDEKHCNKDVRKGRYHLCILIIYAPPILYDVYVCVFFQCYSSLNSRIYKLLS